jgi:hypothetical protein
VAGLIAMRPGSRTRLCHRLRTHPAGKGKRRSIGERDFIALIDGVHHLVKAPIVLVWDRLNTHVSHAMRELISQREWLTVFLLPAYAPDLNPVEWVWAHVKRSLANLAVVALDQLEVLVRNRLKRLQYRPDTLDGFIAGTGLPLGRKRGILTETIGLILAVTVTAAGLSESALGIRPLDLHDYEDLACAEIDTMRYRIYHLPACLAHHARRRLQIERTRPWAHAFALA